jgi:hypothetical protein
MNTEPSFNAEGRAPESRLTHHANRLISQVRAGPASMPRGSTQRAGWTFRFRMLALMAGSGVASVALVFALENLR